MTKILYSEWPIYSKCSLNDIKPTNLLHFVLFHNYELNLSLISLFQNFKDQPVYVIICTVYCIETLLNQLRNYDTFNIYCGSHVCLTRFCNLEGYDQECWRNLSSTLISLYHYSDHTPQNCKLCEIQKASTLNIENIIVS